MSLPALPTALPSLEALTRDIERRDYTASPSKWFDARLEPKASWGAWRVFLAALFGSPLAGDEFDIFRRHTEREHPPQGQAREAYLIVGRRGGKSRVAGALAVYLAVFRDYTPFLVEGERATIPVLAADRRQARTIFRYVIGALESRPELKRLIQGEPRSDGVDLINRVTIEVQTASAKAVRGYTIPAALLDEVAFWPTDDAADPDFEIIRALKPGMATIPGALMLGMSSPYSRRGVLWQAYRDHYGKDSPVLVWKGDTLSMNPSIDQALIDEAYENDPEAADAEYGANFRKDLEAFVSEDTINALIASGRNSLPPLSGVNYFAFVDPSGGSSDSMTMAIGHLELRDRERVVIDRAEERKPPFSPDVVVDEFCGILKEYGVNAVTGDQYGGEWCREPFRKHGVNYDLADKVKSELYRGTLPAMNSGRVELLDIKRLKAQFVRLERRTGRGRDVIDHAPGDHDDLANAVAGVIEMLTRDGFRSVSDSYALPSPDDEFD